MSDAFGKTEVMKKKPKDGGSAFPHATPVGAWGDPSQGMTLRDYFAAKAMQSFLASESLMKMSNLVVENTGLRRGEWVAQQAYAFADDMIAERAK